jgi:hypothetical protein
VSSAEETAFEVDRLLADCNGAGIDGAASNAAEQTAGHHAFVTSGDVEWFRRLGARFCGPEVEHVEAFHW